MSSGSFWSDACNTAEGRPLPAKLNAAYASCGVTVRCALLLLLLMLFALRAAVQLYRPVCDALLRRLPRTA